MTRPPPHPDLRFRALATEGPARAGQFETPHGIVRTPAFMPVGTRASLKGLTLAQVETIGPEILLANTYHLHLRPGEGVIRDLGGLHGFTGWRRPWITDSGGYQVFSLTDLVRIGEDTVVVKSHLDGEPVLLGPKEATAIQEALGADLIMAFDHCVGLPAPRDVLAEAVDRTTRWTRMCADARTRDDQALFGIVQGGTDPELRERSARDLVGLGLPGYAVGGLAVGEGGEAMRATLAATLPHLPADRPRYLMGVGPPMDLLDAVALGVDLFDCVLPTRNGRRAYLYTHDGPVRITGSEHERSDAPLDPECRCEVCHRHSRGYLRHLFAVDEHVAVTLGALHNVTFFVDLLRRAREALIEGGFSAFRDRFGDRWKAGEARWKEAHAEDPDGREGSRRARAQRDQRRRKLGEQGLPL